MIHSLSQHIENHYKKEEGEKNLGFWFILAPLIQAGIQAGTAIYQNESMKDITEEKMEMDQNYMNAQIDIAQKKAELEGAVNQAQIRIAEIQAQGIAQRNEIDLELAKAQLDYAQKQLILLAELDTERAELEKMKLEQEKESLSPLSPVPSNSSIISEKSFFDYILDYWWISVGIIGGALLLRKQ